MSPMSMLLHGCVRNVLARANKHGLIPYNIAESSGVESRLDRIKNNFSVELLKRYASHRIRIKCSRITRRENLNFKLFIFSRPW